MLLSARQSALRYILKEAIRTQLHDRKDPALVKAKWLASVVALTMMITATLCSRGASERGRQKVQASRAGILCRWS